MGTSISDKLKRLICEALEPSLATIEERDRQTKEELENLRDRLVAVTERSDKIETELIKSLALQQEMLRAMAQLQEQFIGELENGLERSVAQIDKQIERWTWERFKRTDKQIERWTWDRHKRVQKLIDSGFWNIHYELKKSFGALDNENNVRTIYDDYFYFNNRFGSVRSARKILGFLLPKLQCNSIVDFGCGTGTWLWVAQGYGVSEVLGIDGEYVPENMLMIPQKCFSAADLSEPCFVTKRYDLALSLEVAEHIPERSADIFIDNICKSADIVLFSAAHPGQGGDGHINEQPIEYWIEKFYSHHYVPIEIRSNFQFDNEVESWYKENIVLYVTEEQSHEVRIIIENH